MAAAPGTGVTLSGRLPAIAGAALAATGLMLLTTLLGVPGVLLALLVPVPAAWAQLRYGLAAGLAAVLLTAGAAQLIGGGAGLIAYLLQFGLMALLLPGLLRRGLAWDRAVAGTVLAVFVTALVALLLLAHGRDQSVAQLVDAYVASEIAQARTLLDTGDLPADRLREVEEFLGDFARFLSRAYPGITTVAAALMALLTVLCLARLPGSAGKVPGPRLATWKAPEFLVWPLIVAGFLQVFTGGMAETVGTNLLVVLVFVYYLQGLAVLTHLFEMRRLSPLLRGIGYMLALFFNPLPLVVAGVGLFDLWIDFRKRITLKPGL